MGTVGKMLSVIGIAAAMLVVASFEGWISYKGEPLGLYILREVTGQHDSSSEANSDTAPPPQTSTQPRKERYASKEYGFSFEYLSPPYDVVYDQESMEDSAFTDRDFVLLCVRPEDTFGSDFSGIVVLVDTDKEYTKTGDGWSHVDAASVAAFDYQEQMKEQGFEPLLHDETRVGNRRGYWQMVAGEADGAARVYMAYFVATDRALYTIVYSAPEDDEGAERRRECDSIVQSFVFQ